MKDPWFLDLTNIQLLVSYLADAGYDAHDVAYAVEKPWKYEDEFLLAVQELLGETEDVDEIE